MNKTTENWRIDWYKRKGHLAGTMDEELFECTMLRDYAMHIAATIIGSRSSDRKAASSANNGKLGGRPKGNG